MRRAVEAVETGTETGTGTQIESQLATPAQIEMAQVWRERQETPKSEVADSVAVAEAERAQRGETRARLEHRVVARVVHVAQVSERFAARRERNEERSRTTKKRTTKKRA